TLRASKDSLVSDPMAVTTGISGSISNGSPQIGNIWGADIRLDYHPTPALTLQKSCTPINAEAGDTLTYTLSYQNTGLAPATQLLLTDVLPSDVTYVSGSATGGGSYNADLHTLTWSLGSLPAGQPGQVTFRVTVNAGVSAGTCIANTGKLTCIELESPTISNIVTTIIGSHPADEWWMFQNNAQHTGRSPISGPHSPTTKWTYAVDGAIPTSSPVFGQDGTAYVAFSDNYVYAISLDGALKWRSDQTGGLLNSTPAVGVDGTIYVGSTDGKVYAFNPDDGSVKWTFLTMGSISSSPAIGTDGCIYISSVYILYALNQDGTLRWSSSRGGYVYTSPAIGSDGMIYCGSTDGNLYAIKPDGTDRWVFHTGAKICAAPTVGDNGNIYVGSNDHKLYAVKFDGTQQWAFDTGDSINSTAAIGVDGTIYVGSNNHKVYVINPAGIQLWAFTTGDMVESSPAIDANGIIYIGSNDHNIYAINPDGIRQWCYSTGDAVTSSPSIASDGTLYVGSKDGAIYAFNDNLQLSGVICHTLPDSRCAVNTPVTLTATAFGGTHLEYAFLVNGIEQQAYSAQSSCPWRPTTPGYYALQVKARNLNDDNSVAQEVVSPVVIYTVTNALSRVTLTPTPISIQAMNTPVTLKATATGGANVVYKFMRNGQVLRDYSSSDTFVWTPIEAGDNAISVLAKDLNSANPGLEVSSTSIPFHVQPRVTLTVSPTSSQPVNTAILLTANVQGMNNPRFRFRIGYQDIWGRWMWSDLTGYSSSRMATWRPIVARTYTIMVWVRESTSRNSYDASQSLTYTVTTR
ncbi:MAG TPA: PQQ-binding-like beta-propeller repeat protein, partial [Armatimonadota bacterium]|nr:PQQ-binding-like beta-propeller repeat protein [Armatimonadota bacterium]